MGAPMLAALRAAGAREDVARIAAAKPALAGPAARAVVDARLPRGLAGEGCLARLAGVAGEALALRPAAYRPLEAGALVATLPRAALLQGEGVYIVTMLKTKMN